MPNEWFNEKKLLLIQFKDQTKQQLKAIQDEDSELFLQSVEACDQMIQLIDRLDQQAICISDAEKLKLANIISDILGLREQISQITPNLHRKLMLSALAEQRSAQFDRAYGNEHYFVPSLFYDKRK